MVDFEKGCKQNVRPLELGGVPEWPKGSDCKSDGSAFGGPNPPPSTSFFVATREWSRVERNYLPFEKGDYEEWL